MKTIIPLYALAVIGVLALPACQTMPATGPATTTAVTRPAAPPNTAQSRRYRIDADRSEIQILVYRSGRLARLGHNHVIAARRVRGNVYINQPFAQSSFQLEIPVDGFEVDPPAMRADEGAEFESTPSQEAIAGTRKHMLGTELLDAATYPEIRIRSTHISGPAWEPDITLRIRLHGITRQLTTPVAIERGARQLTATGSFSIRQSEFGIVPFSVLGGGLQVQNAVRLRFRIVARTGDDI